MSLIIQTAIFSDACSYSGLLLFCLYYNLTANSFLFFVLFLLWRLLTLCLLQIVFYCMPVISKPLLSRAIKIIDLFLIQPTKIIILHVLLLDHTTTTKTTTIITTTTTIITHTTINTTTSTTNTTTTIAKTTTVLLLLSSSSSL